MTSVAVNVTFSAARLVTVNTTAPLAADDTALAGVITALLPAFLASVTVLPPTMLPSMSRSDTTICTVVAPSAGGAGIGVPGAGGNPNVYGTTVDVTAETGPGDCPASARCNRFMLGEPRPTCAKSDPIEAAP